MCFPQYTGPRQRAYHSDEAAEKKIREGYFNLRAGSRLGDRKLFIWNPNYRESIEDIQQIALCLAKTRKPHLNTVHNLLLRNINHLTRAQQTLIVEKWTLLCKEIRRDAWRREDKWPAQDIPRSGKDVNLGYQTEYGQAQQLENRKSISPSGSGCKHSNSERLLRACSQSCRSGSSATGAPEMADFRLQSHQKGSLSGGQIRPRPAPSKNIPTGPLSANQVRPRPAPLKNLPTAGISQAWKAGLRLIRRWI